MENLPNKFTESLMIGLIWGILLFVGYCGLAMIVKYHTGFDMFRDVYKLLKNAWDKFSSKNANNLEVQTHKPPAEYETYYKFADDLTSPNNNYRKKPLLTDHEYKFYCALTPIAKKYGFCILSKIRIADLVEPTAHVYKERSDYYHYFGKIKAKHIDFALCDPANLEVKLLIELDDWTHETAKGRERDEFVESVYEDTGYRLLRVTNNWQLEEKICDILDITEEYKIKTP